MKKMTGYEYKQFINADWDKLLGVTNAYMDGEEITVNGAEEHSDLDLTPDDAKVIIYSGCVCADQDIDLSLIACYNRWKKAQTKTVFMVEIPNSEVDYFKQQVTICKGKVIK